MISFNRQLITHVGYGLRPRINCTPASFSSHCISLLGPVALPACIVLQKLFGFTMCLVHGTSIDDIKSLWLITSIKTPYLPDGRFDLEAYDDLVNMQIEGGADGVIISGTTGQG